MRFNIILAIFWNFHTVTVDIPHTFPYHFSHCLNDIRSDHPMMRSWNTCSWWPVS